MNTLTQEMKDMIATQQCFVGTIDADGYPNVAPKRSTRVLSDNSLIFSEGTGGATYENIKRGSKVSVAVVNRDILDGYRFVGEAILHESGDLYEQSAAMSVKMGMPKPRAVVVINIAEIHTLKPGPTAGKKLIRIDHEILKIDKTMESKIASAIGMKYSPVAVLFTDDKPENAMQFKEGRWGCVVTMFIAAAKGRTAIFDRKTFGCLGGGVGLGFGNQYVHFPGGIECYVSTGNKEFARTPEAANFRTSTPLDEGEGYFKSPEIAKKFVDALPMTEVPTTYVVYKPLDQLTEEETPEVVVFLANVEQLSALSVLANYERGTGPSVIMPFGAGCHTLGIIPYAEAKSGEPSAVIGLTDISARRHVDKDLLSFAVPFSMFLKMEENVEGSFLKKEVWMNLMERNN